MLFCWRVDVAADAAEGDAGVIGQRAVGQKNPRIAACQIAEIGQRAGALGEARMAGGDSEQQGAVFAGEREGMEQIEDLAALERDALDLQGAHVRLHVANLIEAQTDGFAFLSFAQIGDGFAGFGEGEFRSLRGPSAERARGPARGRRRCRRSVLATVATRRTREFQYCRKTSLVIRNHPIESMREGSWRPSGKS